MEITKAVAPNVVLQDVSAALAAACPDGIDVVYEGVGGALRAAIWPHIKPGGKLLQVGCMRGHTHHTAANPPCVLTRPSLHPCIHAISNHMAFESVSDQSAGQLDWATAQWALTEHAHALTICCLGVYALLCLHAGGVYQ